jgi:hypothetical protein
VVATNRLWFNDFAYIPVLSMCVREEMAFDRKTICCVVRYNSRYQHVEILQTRIVTRGECSNYGYLAVHTKSRV